MRKAPVSWIWAAGLVLVVSCGGPDTPTNRSPSEAGISLDGGDFSSSDDGGGGTPTSGCPSTQPKVGETCGPGVDEGGGDHESFRLGRLHLQRAAAVEDAGHGEVGEDDLEVGGGPSGIAAVHDLLVPHGSGQIAGAVGLSRPVARVRLRLLAVDDEGGRVGEFREEVGLRRVEREAHGLIVEHFDALHVLGGVEEVLAHANDVAEVGEGER